MAQIALLTGFFEMKYEKRNIEKVTIISSIPTGLFFSEKSMKVKIFSK